MKSVGRLAITACYELRWFKLVISKTRLWLLLADRVSSFPVLDGIWRWWYLRNLVCSPESSYVSPGKQPGINAAYVIIIMVQVGWDLASSWEKWSHSQCWCPTCLSCPAYLHMPLGWSTVIHYLLASMTTDRQTDRTRWKSLYVTQICFLNQIGEQSSHTITLEIKFSNYGVVFSFKL